MKLYGHEFDQPSPRANFLVPTLMDKVYLEGERQANLEVVLSCFGNNMTTTTRLQVDGGIMDQMTVVGLATDCGRIVPKDLWAHRSPYANVGFSVAFNVLLRIRLASQQGDIICEGTIEGDVIAETQGEGDFKARLE